MAMLAESSRPVQQRGPVGRVQEGDRDDRVRRRQQEALLLVQHDLADQVPGPDEDDEQQRQEAPRARPVPGRPPAAAYGASPSPPGVRHERRTADYPVLTVFIRLRASGYVSVLPPRAECGTAHPPDRPKSGSNRKPGCARVSNGTGTSATIRPGRLDMTTTRLDRKTGLGDRVGDEQRGEPAVLVQLRQLDVQPLPGQLVEGGERFVEQEQLGLEHQRAGQRGPHPHPTGQRGAAGCARNLPGRPPGSPRPRAAAARPGAAVPARPAVRRCAGPSARAAVSGPGKRIRPGLLPRQVTRSRELRDPTRAAAACSCRTRTDRPPPTNSPRLTCSPRLSKGGRTVGEGVADGGEVEQWIGARAHQGNDSLRNSEV